MGRRAKYLDKAQRSSASHLRQNSYGNSPRCVSKMNICNITLLNLPYSGKSVRKASRQEHYRREHGRQGSSTSRPRPTTLRLPPLSARLVDMATRSLPCGSRLFQRALNDPESIDDSELKFWNTGPPYAFHDVAEHEGAEHSRMERLVEVMHGWRLRLQRDADVKHQEEFEMDGQGVMLRWEAGIIDMLEDYKTTRQILREHSDSVQERRMAMVFHQWQAREIFHLYNLEFLQSS